MLPAGTYYVGDLCYVMNSRWSEVCDKIITKKREVLDGQFELADGTTFAIHSTADGDGSFQDENGFEYSVDSGSLGCVLLAASEDSAEMIKQRNLGQVVVFDKPFNTSSSEGIVNIGHISIDTSPEYEQRWFGDGDEEDEEDESL